MDIIPKIHKFLSKNKKALIINYGYRDKNRCGIVFSGDRLWLVELRDYRLIRGRKQDDIDTDVNIDEKIKALTENNELELHQKFMKMLQEGTPLPEVTPKEATKIVVEADWLEA